MKYIVSGYRRSGTSAMVKALSAGLSKNKLFFPGYEDKPTLDGYIPNPGGLFEIGQIRYKNAKFLRTHLKEEGIMKIFFDGLTDLPADDYVVVFMLRDPEEIALSIERTEQYFEDLHDRGLDLHDRGLWRNTDLGKRYHPFDVFRPYDQDDIDHVLGIIEQRNDMQVHIVQYQDLIDVPEAVFARLQREKCPALDIYKAAAVINPELHRSHAPSP